MRFITDGIVFRLIWAFFKTRDDLFENHLRHFRLYDHLRFIWDLFDIHLSHLRLDSWNSLETLKDLMRFLRLLILIWVLKFAETLLRFFWESFEIDLSSFDSRFFLETLFEIHLSHIWCDAIEHFKVTYYKPPMINPSFLMDSSTLTKKKKQLLKKYPRLVIINYYKKKPSPPN